MNDCKELAMQNNIARLEVAVANRDLVIAQIDRVRDFLLTWIGDGSLQTFEHRERFRGEARELLKNTFVAWNPKEG